MASRVLLVVLTAVAIWPVSSSPAAGNRPRNQLHGADRTIIIPGQDQGNHENAFNSDGSDSLSLPSESHLERPESSIKYDPNLVNEIRERKRGRPLRVPRDRDGSYAQSTANSEPDANRADQNRRRAGNLSRKAAGDPERVKQVVAVASPTPRHPDGAKLENENEIIPRDMEIVYKPSNKENVVSFSGRISHPDDNFEEKDLQIDTRTTVNITDEKLQHDDDKIFLRDPVSAGEDVTHYQKKKSGPEQVVNLAPVEVATFLRAIQQEQLASAQARMRATKASREPAEVSLQRTVDAPSMNMVPPGPRAPQPHEEIFMRQGSRTSQQIQEKNAHRLPAAENEDADSKEESSVYDDIDGSSEGEHDEFQGTRDDDKFHDSSAPDTHAKRHPLNTRKLQHGTDENSQRKGNHDLAKREKAKDKLKPPFYNDQSQSHRYLRRPLRKFTAHDQIKSKGERLDSKEMSAAGPPHREGDERPALHTNILPQQHKGKPIKLVQRKLKKQTNNHPPSPKNDETHFRERASHGLSTSAKRERVSPLTNKLSRSDKHLAFEQPAVREGREYRGDRASGPQRNNQNTGSGPAHSSQDLHKFILQPQKTAKENSEGSYKPRVPRVREKKISPDSYAKLNNSLRSDMEKHQPTALRKNIIFKKKQRSEKYKPDSSKSNLSGEEIRELEASRAPTSQLHAQSSRTSKKKPEIAHKSQKPKTERAYASRRSPKRVKKPRVLQNFNKNSGGQPNRGEKSGGRLQAQRSQGHAAHSAPPLRPHAATTSHHRTSKEPMKSSASEKGKKKGKSRGFEKSHKSGHKEAKGHAGNKGHTAKEGHKKTEKEEYDQDHAEKHHNKGALEEDSAHHGEHHQGHYDKGQKGITGHKRGTSDHKQKGHNEKGFEEVRHSKEYMVQKKHYKDVDDKEYHGDHDHFDKFFEKFKKGVFEAGSFLGDKHHKKHHKEGHHADGHHHHHHLEHEKHHSDDGDHHHHSEHGNDEGHHEKHESGDPAGH